MNRSISLWQWLGFGITSLGGTLLHFLYEWSGESIFTAPFSAVNESTWEHMKLLFFPMFFFALIQSRFFEERKDFWCVKLKGILLGLILIPMIFYTYNGVIGPSPDWINIAIFFISAAITYIYEARLFKDPKTDCKSEKRAFIILCIIGILFVIFTFATPRLNIFKDPLTESFGLNG